MANKKPDSKDLAEIEEIVKQSNLLNENASAEHSLFADLNKSEYEKYYQKCLNAKEIPSKTDFYETYDLTYPNAKQQKDYAKRVYETSLPFAADFPISQNRPEISALSLFAKKEFEHYVSTHKFILPKNHTYGEAERQVAFFDELEDQLDKLKNAKSAKDLQTKRDLEEKLELSKNFAKYLSNNSAQHDFDDYAKIFNNRFEKFKAMHPTEWLPEDLKAKIVIDAYLKSAFYTEELLNGTMAQSQQYAEKAKHARTNGIFAYADFYNDKYQEFLDSIRDEDGNISISEEQAKTTFYLRNGGNLNNAPIDGVQYYKDGDEHNLMFDIDTGSSQQYVNIVVKDGKSSLRLSDGTLAELNSEEPFVLNGDKFIAQSIVGNFELPVGEHNCKSLDILKNYPAQIPANVFEQIDKKTYQDNISNISDVVFRGSPANETTNESQAEIQSKILLYKAGDVNYCYFPYKTDTDEDSYFRVIQKGGKPYINLQNPTTNAAETYEIELFQKIDNKLFMQVQKDGHKTIQFPVPYKKENLKILRDFYLFTTGRDFQATEITVEQCPNVPNFTLNEVVAQNAPELESTKIVQPTSKQGKAGQVLVDETFTTFDGAMLNGYSQNITFAKTTGISENQKLTMLDARNSNLLFNVTDKNKTIAEFVEESGKIILKLDKETVTKFIAANKSVNLDLKENKNYFSCEIEKLMLDQKGDISIKAANTNNAYSLSALGVQIADKFGSRGVLKSDSILNIGVTDKGYEAALKGEYGCSINPNAKNLDNALSATYAVIERQKKTATELHSSKPINLSNVPNLEIYSVPVKLKDGSEQFLNIKKENGETFVYMHITSEKNENKAIAPQWFKVNNASFNETNPTQTKIDDPAIHFDLVASNNTTANVRVPFNNYNENANAIAAMQNIFSREFATAVNGRDGKPAETFSRKVKTREGNEITIDAYRRADDTNAASLVDLDKVSVLSRVDDKSAAAEPTSGLVSGHPVGEIADPVVPAAASTASASPDATSTSPDATTTADDAHTADDAPATAPSTEATAPSTTPAAASAPAKEEKKESEWKKISKAALLPVGLALAIPGVLFPPLFLVGAIMLGAHALNQVSPGWLGKIGKLFRGETAEEKADRLQKENERYLNLSKADLERNNAQIESLKAEREKIINDPTLSDAKKQKKLAKLDSQIRSINEENIAINSTRSYVQSQNTRALLETEHQKNINDQQLAKDKLKAVEKADKANAKPLEKQQKQAIKDFEKTRNGMIKLADELDSLTKLSKTRELTPREEKRRQEVYNQLINNEELKQTYQDRKQVLEEANANVQAQRDLTEQHQNEYNAQIRAAEAAQEETERRIEEQNTQEIEAAETSRQELNEDLKPYTPEWARRNTANQTAATTLEHETGVVHVPPVTSDSGRTSAREH